jgi:tyrosine-protein kinase
VALEHLSRQDGTSLGTYLGVLRRRAWIVVVCAVVAPVVAYALSNRHAPIYSASADVYVNQQNIASALTGISSTPTSTQAVAVETQASLAAVPAVARRALRVAKRHDRSPGAVLGQTTITPNPTTSMLTFTVTDRSPTVAQLLATAYARAFTVYSNRLQSQPIVRARNEVEAAMAKLKDEGRGHSALYASLEEKDQQLQTLETLQTSGTVVVRPANPGVKISPHPWRSAAIGLVLGLVLGLGLCFALEAIDNRVRSAGEIGEGLGGLPLLGRIPPPSTEMQKRNELAIVVQPKQNAAEAFRLLRANLAFVRISAGDVRTIVVTSAVEKEGKSTTSANLAIAEARSGRRVALVDLDLRRPYLDRFFRLPAAEGVTDVALGEVTLEEAMQRIDLHLGAPESAAGLSRLLAPGRGPASRTPVADAGVLDVLVSGLLPPDPGEFAASHRLERSSRSSATRTTP